MILTYLILAIVFDTNVPILTSALVHSMLKRSSFLSSVTSKEVEELHPPTHTHTYILVILLLNTEPGLTDL